MSPLIQSLELGQEGFLRDESRRSGTAESIAFPKSEAEVIDQLLHVPVDELYD